MMIANTRMMIIIAVTLKVFTEGVLHPTLSVEKEMDCEEFGQSARFNPYSVLDEIWFVFFYWGDKMPRTEYQFFFPTAKERNYIRSKIINTTVPVDWSARMVVMKNVHRKTSTLLVEKGEKGQFWMYHFQNMQIKGKNTEPVNVQMKQTADGRFIGFMNCAEHIVYAMCRMSQIPRKKLIPEAIAQIGYRGRGGVSYLYAGHHWAPMPESDEEEYWTHPEMHERNMEALRQQVEMDPHKDSQPDHTKPPLFENKPHLYI